MGVARILSTLHAKVNMNVTSISQNYIAAKWVSSMTMVHLQLYIVLQSCLHFMAYKQLVVQKVIMSSTWIFDRQCGALSLPIVEVLQSSYAVILIVIYGVTCRAVASGGQGGRVPPGQKMGR